MAAAGADNGVLTLRVVYCGAPGAGKTTNLERVAALIHGNEAGRITPRLVGENRIASLEIPAGSLGLLLGASVVVRLETMQGEVSSAGRVWSAALAQADGIVFVADSSPHARTANVRALAAVRERLEGRDRSAAVPVVMQWNKRDQTDARPIAELEVELNHRCFPSIASSSRRDTGIAETLIEILKRTIGAAHRKTGGRPLAEAELDQVVRATIEQLSQSARADASERYGMTIERHASAWPEVREAPRRDRDANIEWQQEALYSAQSLGQETLEARMLAALERAASEFADPNAAGLPRGLMAGLLAGCDRTRGALILTREGPSTLEEFEIASSGSDPLALSVSLSFGSVTFGSMVVYVATGEHPPTPAEQAYWKTAATLAGGYLAWQAAETRPVAERRKRSAPGADLVEHLDP